MSGEVPRPSGPAPTESVTLHSSWRGLLGSAFGATAVLAAGLFGVALGGWRVFPTVLVVVGAVFVAIVLLDYPVATTISHRGIDRRMVVWRQHLGWDRVRLITRVRPGITPRLRGAEHGGLAAVVGRRRILLVDQPESPAEFDQLYRIAGDRADDLGLHNRLRTGDGTNPTWLYRRAKWAPDGAERR